MSPVAIGAIFFACIFGAALLGMALRTVLPQHHLSEASNDVVRLVARLIATLAALVLGLLIASAKTSFDTLNEGFRQSAVKIILLDQALAQYGPETTDLRELIRNDFANRVDAMFSKAQTQRAALNSAQGTNAIATVQRSVRALVPQSEAQRSLQSRALDLSDSLAQVRWHAIEYEDNAIPPLFLLVLGFWLAVMFTGFGLFAPRHGLAIAVFVLGSASLAGAIFLIEELNSPLGGLIAISRAPMDMALGQLGR